MKVRTIRTEADCRSEIERMLKTSQTRAIMATLALGVLRRYVESGRTAFDDTALRTAYHAAVREITELQGHNVHTGAKYEDAYGMRMSRYGFLTGAGHLQYRLTAPFSKCASALVDWLPVRIVQHIASRVGIIPQLADSVKRLEIASSQATFMQVVESQIAQNPVSFEIASFAIIKIHLERFACKIYRDTRTAAHDRGVDLSTNFGVVYQVKKLRVQTRGDADKLYTELKANFDRERLQDGNVILVIDDIVENVRQYLINMKVQSIKTEHLLVMAAGFSDVEDRQKVLRVIYEEFCRDYAGVAK